MNPSFVASKMFWDVDIFRGNGKSKTNGLREGKND